MAEVLTTVWFASAAGGLIASVIAVLGDRAKQRSRLQLGEACFAVAGVLGTLSVGIVFPALAVACLTASSRTEKQPAAAASD